MFVDVPGLAEDAVLEADVCIVGSGPAGTSLALALEGRGLDVLLLEAGGESFDPDGLDVYDGIALSNVSDSIDAYLTISRARYFGGTSNLWAGWCRPLQPEDFEVRPWVPYSGWPIAYDDLAPWYDDATTFLEISPFPGTEAWSGTPRPPLALDPALLETRVWQFSPPTRFATRYGDDLDASDDIRVALDANLVGIERSSSGSGTRVEQLELRTLAGKRFFARGRATVLATGGIENARLLLAFGIGSDATGRFFQEHPGVRGTMELQVSGDALGLYTERGRDDVVSRRSMGLLALPAAVQASEELLNQAIMLRSVGEVERDASSEAIEAWLGHQTGQATAVGLAMATCEQSPNPDSRVTLMDVTDTFGMRRGRLDWRVVDSDWTRAVRSLELAADGLAASGFGRGRMRVDRSEPWAGMSTGMHAMGTTRMAVSEVDGVVDENSRVFGVEDLYIAGSSVFPTGGAANPTLTIVALALRLADHLSEVL